MHPGMQKCCPKACGQLCGAPSCANGIGGAAACCKQATGISECSSTSMAPCLIPAVSSVYAGVVELNMTNPMSFVGSARSRIACHLALAKVLGLPGEDVIITGISAGPVGSNTIQPAVGYEVITSAAEQLTASEIAAKAMPLQLALNSALQMNGVNATISAIQMPDPAVAHSSQTTTTTTSTSTGEVLLIFKGSMLLTVSDKAKFLKSPSVELACQEAMIGAMQEAMVVEVSKDAVTMQGIRDASEDSSEPHKKEAEEAKSGVVAVDFELNVKSSTETTADKIVALAPDVKAHLNSELDAKELSESVSKVEMKMPHVKRYYVVPGDDETSEKKEKEKKKEDRHEEEDEANEGKEEKKKDEEEEKQHNEKQEKDEQDAEKEEEKTKEEEKQKEEEEEGKDGEGEEQEHEDDQKKKKSKGKEGGGKEGKGEEK